MRADLEAQGWPLTGRAVRVAMYGLSGRELYGDANAKSVLDRTAAHGVEALTVPDRQPDLGGYVERALRGGSPKRLWLRLTRLRSSGSTATSNRS